MTLLEGPYDSLSTTDKRRLQCMISKDAYERWFAPGGAFSLRGAQDKILARMFHLLDTFMTTYDLIDPSDPHSEDTLNAVMSEMAILYKKPTDE